MEESGKQVETTCAPFQFALSTRAGTDCVGHAIRALTDADLTATVLSIDGIGAYDHVLRSTMMSKLYDERIVAVRPFHERPTHRVFLGRRSRGATHDQTS